jgi:putative hydrolase of the HAD superfamily
VIVAATEAVLIDVYRTVLRVDFDLVDRNLAEAAGVPVDLLRDALEIVAPDVTIGALTMTDALDRALRSCGARPSAAVADLVRLDKESLLEASTVYDDVVPFLAQLDSLGVRAAFISNCAENTRPLLEQLGLADLVDAVILSCEVGAAKPSAEIFERALSVLAVEPSAALLVDDQPEYCDGATAIGMHAVRISRGGAGERPARGASLIHSLDELLSRFVGRAEPT